MQQNATCSARQVDLISSLPIYEIASSHWCRVDGATERYEVSASDAERVQALRENHALDRKLYAERLHQIELDPFSYGKDEYDQDDQDDQDAFGKDDGVQGEIGAVGVASERPASFALASAVRALLAVGGFATALVWAASSLCGIFVQRSSALMATELRFRGNGRGRQSPSASRPDLPGR
jgi:hypothetical protein